MPSAGIPADKMQTFTAPGDIFPDEGVVSKVDEIPKSGAPKFYINVDDLKAAIDVSFGASADGHGFIFALDGNGID